MIKNQITVEELREILKSECEKAENQKEWAKSNNLLPSCVNEALTGQCGIPMSIAEALGYRKIICYTKV